MNPERGAARPSRRSAETHSLQLTRYDSVRFSLARHLHGMKVPDVANWEAANLINSLAWPAATAAVQRAVVVRAHSIRLRSQWGFRCVPSFRRSWHGATAALEFALATPLLVCMLGGAADLGLAQFYRANLANAVAAGSEYAFLTAQTGGTTAVTAANIKTVVTDTMFLPAGGAASLTITVTGPNSYCVTGTGPTMSAATFGSTCSDGSTAGTYVIVSASYKVTGLMNGFMGALTQTMTESATARLN